MKEIVLTRLWQSQILNHALRPIRVAFRGGLPIALAVLWQRYRQAFTLDRRSPRTGFNVTITVVSAFLIQRWGRPG